MKRFIKEICRLIIEDFKQQLKALLTVVLIILLSFIPVKFIDDPVVAMRVVGLIVVVVLYFSLFYERKNKCLYQHISGLPMKIIHL